MKKDPEKTRRGAVDRVPRGGSWSNRAKRVRAADRCGVIDDNCRLSNMSLRLVRTTESMSVERSFDEEES